MKFITLTLIGLASTFVAAYEPDPFPEGNMTWTGPITHGRNITLHGKPHHIAAQLEKLNPYWLKAAKEAANVSLANDFHHPHFQHKNSAGGLEKRTIITKYICNAGVYQKIDIPDIGWAANYLSQYFHNGNCGVWPYSCARYSCYNDASILLCNSSPYHVEMPCGIFVGQVWNVFDTCRQWPVNNAINAQMFYENPAFNILIKHTDPGKDCVGQQG